MWATEIGLPLYQTSEAPRQGLAGLASLLARHRRRDKALASHHYRAGIHPTFFKLYQGWNEAKMIMQAKMFSAMGVWTSLEPQLTTPTTSPSLQGGGEPRVRGPV